MKRLLQIALFIFCSMSITAQTTVNLSMDSNYANEVYYKLSTGTENTYLANNWDIAFLRVDSFTHGIRVNGGIGIQVFEASNDPADWNAIDVADEGSWTPLYNDDTNWDNGAFMQGSATYGWGEYNPITHHVEGTIIFVLKYANGTYRKFINEDYFGEYTFKYATWDGANWVGENTVTIANSSNPDNRYNYYSLQNNQEVISEPSASDWDMVFRRYVTDLGGGTFYAVTGVLHNPGVTVAQNEEPGGGGDPNGLNYSEEINTIGYDWKTFNGTSFDVNSDMAYYVKYDANTVYRMSFTDFEGSSTGNLTFNFEDVSNLLGLEDVTENISFGMYPNPTTNKVVSIVYDVAEIIEENKVEIYAMNGVKVFSEKLTNSPGFYNRQLDLSELQSGIYLVHVTSGTGSISKKLILN